MVRMLVDAHVILSSFHRMGRCWYCCCVIAHCSVNVGVDVGVGVGVIELSLLCCSCCQE